MTPEDTKAMQQRYRNVFSTMEGQKVLGDIAELGHLFDPIHPEDIAAMGERNLALTIFRMAGALDVLYRQLSLVREEDGPDDRKPQP